MMCVLTAYPALHMAGLEIPAQIHSSRAKIDAQIASYASKRAFIRQAETIIYRSRSAHCRSSRNLIETYARQPAARRSAGACHEK
jgi:hypothetical protein